MPPPRGRSRSLKGAADPGTFLAGGIQATEQDRMFTLMVTSSALFNRGRIPIEGLCNLRISKTTSAIKLNIRDLMAEPSQAAIAPLLTLQAYPRCL